MIRRGKGENGSPTSVSSYGHGNGHRADTPSSTETPSNDKIFPSSLVSVSALSWNRNSLLFWCVILLLFLFILEGDENVSFSFQRMRSKDMSDDGIEPAEADEQDLMHTASTMWQDIRGSGASKMDQLAQNAINLAVETALITKMHALPGGHDALTPGSAKEKKKRRPQLMLPDFSKHGGVILFYVRQGEGVTKGNRIFLFSPCVS
jgi:hypothetical protein